MCDSALYGVARCVVRFTIVWNHGAHGCARDFPSKQTRAVELSKITIILTPRSANVAPTQATVGTVECGITGRRGNGRVVGSTGNRVSRNFIFGTKRNLSESLAVGCADLSILVLLISASAGVCDCCTVLLTRYVSNLGVTLGRRQTDRIAGSGQNDRDENTYSPNKPMHIAPLHGFVRVGKRYTGRTAEAPESIGLGDQGQSCKKEG